MYILIAQSLSPSPSGLMKKLLQSTPVLLLLLLLLLLLSTPFNTNHHHLYVTSQSTPPSQQQPSKSRRSLSSSSLTFTVDPREESCFYHDLQANEMFKMEFEVIRGGLLDINFKIYDPYNQPITEKLAFFNRPDDAANDREGQISISARVGGTYRICFDNQMSRWTPKVISFYVEDPSVVAEEKDKDAAANDVAKLANLGPIVDSVINIADKLDGIENVQRHMRVREQSHRDSIEQNNSRVAWLAATETCVLVVLAAIQIRTIMNWFQDKKKFARV